MPKGLIRRNTVKMSGFTKGEMADACKIAAEMATNPSLRAALLEAAKLLKPKKRGRPSKA